MEGVYESALAVYPDGLRIRRGFFEKLLLHSARGVQLRARRHRRVRAPRARPARLALDERTGRGAQVHVFRHAQAFDQGRERAHDPRREAERAGDIDAQAALRVLAVLVGADAHRRDPGAGDAPAAGKGHRLPRELRRRERDHHRRRGRDSGTRPARMAPVPGTQHGRGARGPARGLRGLRQHL